MDKILAVGCSHTDYYYKSLFHPDMDTSWPKWPEIFTNKFDNAICNNIGLSGIGNDIILKKVLYECSLNRYDIVLVLWTDITRIDIYDKHTFYPSLTILENNNFYGLHDKINWIANGRDKGFYKIESSVEAFFKNLFILQEYCKSQSIKLVHGMSNETWEKTILQEMINKFLKFELKLDNSLIGFPFISGVAGSNMRSDVIKRIGEKNAFISDVDLHYSAAGQEVIGNIFYEQFKTIY
jgi:hypothetical protein